MKSQLKKNSAMLYAFKPFHLEQVEAKRVLNLKNFSIMATITIICMATLGTNWLIPIAGRFFKIFTEVW